MNVHVLTDQDGGKVYQYPFYLACLYGHKKVAQWLLQEFSNVESYTNAHYTFRASAAQGQTDIVHWLYEEADPYMKVDYIRMAFTGACAHGRLQTAQRIHSWNHDFTPSHELLICKTLENGHLETLLWLCTVWPNIVRCSQHSHLAWKSACKRGYSDVVKWTLDHCHFTSPCVLDGAFYACVGGHLGLVQYLLAKHKDRLTIPQLNRLLTLACRHGRVSIVQWALAKYSSRVDFEVLFYQACRHGRLTCAQYLLKHSRVLHRKSVQRVAFQTASAHHKYEVVNWLRKTQPTHRSRSL